MADVGRPKKYKTAAEMQTAIDKYFEDCKGEMIKDDDGVPVLNKYGEPVIINAKPPTITGLALAIGFNSRQALLNYQDNKDFNDTVTRAKSIVEAYAEARLFDKDGANGAKFSLANNYKGWAEKSQIDIGNTGDKPFEVSALSEAEIMSRFEQLRDQLKLQASPTQDS